MLTDPQVVTVNAVAKSMARITIGDRQATYANSDETFSLKISHQKANNRIRTMARIDQQAVVTDPLTSVNDTETLTFYCVLDRPGFGFTATQCDQLIAGFKTWLDTTMVTKLYGQES
jgi:hypothetical protein